MTGLRPLYPWFWSWAIAVKIPIPFKIYYPWTTASKADPLFRTDLPSRSSYIFMGIYCRG
jgi:hypothetical protein